MNIALKEWAVIVQAMKAGMHDILLRKGGIADEDQEFRVEHDKFLLFPTYEHQQNDMIDPDYHDLFDQIAADAPPPGQLVIDSWGEVEESFVIKSFDELKKLPDRHVWSEKYLKMRFEYKPEKPLYAVRVRVQPIPKKIHIPDINRYSGCRSWIELDQDIVPAK